MRTLRSDSLPTRINALAGAVWLIEKKDANCRLGFSWIFLRLHAIPPTRRARTVLESFLQLVIIPRFVRRLLPEAQSAAEQLLLDLGQQRCESRSAEICYTA